MRRATFEVDPADPRAPSDDVWRELDTETRLRVVERLPSDFEWATPPEGDPHRIPKTRALETLSEYYRRSGRRIYLSSELPVYYPAERVIAPDLIAVVDVEAHERNRWVVSQEGRGVDLALEIHVAGSATKDFEENVERFARLGIAEYFALDVTRQRLLGFRLGEPGATRYEPIVPQEGRWTSRVLELDLTLAAGRLRFLHGSALLLDAQELIAQLSTMVTEATARAEQGAQRADEEARRAERLATRLRELGVDPDDV